MSNKLNNKLEKGKEASTKLNESKNNVGILI